MFEALALVDGNSFFCSCERLFRPDLLKSPVIVLSNNDGCVVSRTPEAKALGIAMGVPYFKVRELCELNRVAVFSSNFSLYSDLSLRMMEVLGTLAKRIQVYSVDEAFLDLSGLGPLWPEVGLAIKKHVERFVGIPVGVGVAPTKVLAKVANRLAKSGHGIYTLMNNIDRRKILSTFPVEDLWGVGAGRLSLLRSMGIRTALELAEFSNEKLLQKKLTKTGLILKYELQGQAILKLEEEIEKKQEIMCSRTMAQSTDKKDDIKKAIAQHVASVALKLREQNSLCSCLEIFFYSSRFEAQNLETSHQVYVSYPFLEPTADTFLMTKVAMQLVEDKFRSGALYKKAGVRALGLIDKGEGQLSLFSSESRRPAQNTDQIMQVLDAVNARFGRDTLKTAAQGVRSFSYRQENRSPNYTTGGDLCRVR